MKLWYWASSMSPAVSPAPKHPTSVIGFWNPQETNLWKAKPKDTRQQVMHHELWIRSVYCLSNSCLEWRGKSVEELQCNSCCGTIATEVSKCIRQQNKQSCSCGGLLTKRTAALRASSSHTVCEFSQLFGTAEHLVLAQWSERLLPTLRGDVVSCCRALRLPAVLLVSCF